jgi:hypothetical protein
MAIAAADPPEGLSQQRKLEWSGCYLVVVDLAAGTVVVFAVLVGFHTATLYLNPGPL